MQMQFSTFSAWIRRGLIGFALAGVFASPSLYASVTYQYTGANFTRFNYSSTPTEIDPMTVFTTGDNLKFELTLSREIDPFSSIQIIGGVSGLSVYYNHMAAPSPVTPLAWKFSAGPVLYSGNFIDEDPALSFNFYLRTDGAGKVSMWDSRAYTMYDMPPGVGTEFGGVDAYLRSMHGFANFSVDSAASCQGDLACLQRFSFPIGISDVPGQWVMNRLNEPTPVPEPGSLALLGLGLVGLAASRKRKQA